MLFAILMHSSGYRGNNAFINIGANTGNYFWLRHFRKIALHQSRHNVDKNYQQSQKKEHYGHSGKH